MQNDVQAAIRTSLHDARKPAYGRYGDFVGWATDTHGDTVELSNADGENRWAPIADIRWL